MANQTGEETQDIIEEALYSGVFGKPCGCLTKECTKGCRITLDAIDLWNDVKKTLLWLEKRIKNVDQKEIINDLVRRLEQ